MFRLSQKFLQKSPKTKIAVIGAGPSGCSVLHAFNEKRNHNNDYEITCFEKQHNIGGMWNLSNYETGNVNFSSALGENVHSSMYKYLWSNAPINCIQFPDFSFRDFYQHDLPSFVPREVIEKYLRARYEKDEILKKIEFGTAVRWIDYDEKTGLFSIEVEKLDSYSKITYQQRDDSEFKTKQFFDYVFICSGHYHNPNMIQLHGHPEKFSGQILHSSQYRDPNHFKNKRVVTIGSSYSAEDIATQIIKFGGEKVFLSARTKRRDDAAWNFYQMTGYEDKMEKMPMIASVNGQDENNSVVFEDGRIEENIDAIIVCTGFNHYYPFLADNLKLKSRDALYPKKLYKGIFWQDNPKLMYIGAPHTIFTFPLFEIQAAYSRDAIIRKDVMLQNSNSNSAKNRETDIAKWLQKAKIPDPTAAIFFQAEYLKNLLEETDYYDIDVDLYAENYYEFYNNKMNNFMNFREMSLIDPSTGDRSPGLGRRFMECFEDTAEDFVSKYGRPVVKSD